MHRLMRMSLILSVFYACNSGNKLNQDEGLHREAFPSTADAEGAIDSQTVAMPATEKPSESVAEAPAPAAEPDMMEEEENEVAMEPVAVGGAYLTCRYQTGQTQGLDNYQMDCDVAPVTEVKTLIAKAEFYKLDAQGNRTALTIVSQDLLGLKWTLRENFATLPLNRVQVVLSAVNAISVSLTTTITTPLVLTRSANFWLGGEPNNDVTANNQGEDCVEFSNQAMKTNHQNFTGIVTGPLGRMNDMSCTTRYSFLCRNISAGNTAAKWVVSTFQGAFTDSTRACPQGYTFGFPVSEADVKEVSAIVDRNTQMQNIWVNMNDRLKENEFSVLFR